MKNKETDQGTDGENQGFIEIQKQTGLQPYSDNLPYDRERVTGEAEFFLKHLAASKFELGKRLMLLKEKETVQTFALILQDHFGGMSRRTVFNYIGFTKKCIDLTKIKAFGEKNWSNILTLLNSCTTEELKEIEENGINGKVLDEYDSIPARQFKAILKKYKKDAEKVIGKQVSKLEAKLADTKDRLKTLQLQQTDMPEYIRKDWRRGLKHIDKGIQLLTDLHTGDAVEGDAKVMRGFEREIKKLHGQFNACINILKTRLNTRSIPDE